MKQKALAVGVLGALVAAWLALVPGIVTWADMQGYVEAAVAEDLRVIRRDLAEVRESTAANTALLQTLLSD